MRNKTAGQPRKVNIWPMRNKTTGQPRKVNIYVYEK